MSRRSMIALVAITFFELGRLSVVFAQEMRRQRELRAALAEVHERAKMLARMTGGDPV